MRSSLRDPWLSISILYWRKWVFELALNQVFRVCLDSNTNVDIRSSSSRARKSFGSPFMGNRMAKILKEYCVLYSKEIISEKRIRVLPLKHCTYVCSATILVSSFLLILQRIFGEFAIAEKLKVNKNQVAPRNLRHFLNMKYTISFISIFIRSKNSKLP